MALVNKNGQTPAQVQQHDELSQKLAQLAIQQEDLKRHLEACESTLKGICTTEHATAIKKAIDSEFYHVSARMKHGESEIQDISFSLRLGMALLAVVSIIQIVGYIVVNDNVKDNTLYISQIHHLLQGDTSFWYDEENKKLYVRDRTSSDS